MVRTTSKKKAPSIEEFEEFEIDPDLLNPEYNQVRRPVLPYGVVINENPAGILIPVDQIQKAGWIGAMPSEKELHSVTITTEDVTGLLITDARMVVLAYAPEYIRYKSDADEVAGKEVAGKVVGLYEDYRGQLDKKTMEVCSEHAIIFLDDHNQPLHTTPILVRFRNVSLWSFKTAREEFYRQLEKVFAQYAGVRFSGKSDKWRSLGVIECKFNAVKEGTGKNRHLCCKTEEYTMPTLENFPRLFLGTPALKRKVWDLHDNIAGFTNPVLEASPEVKALPPAETPALKGSKARKVVAEVVEDDDEDLDLDSELLDDDEDFDDEDFEEEED